MEYGWNPTHWDGGGRFDMPSNFDSLRRKGQGYPGLGSRVYRFGGCEDVEIDYTTLNMLNNETQELGIKNGKSFAIYSWQVSGTNSNISNLDTALQTTDSRGEAPPNLFTPSGIQSNDSVTFQLIDRGIDEICDEITITVRCSNGSWVSQSEESKTNTCGPFAPTNYKDCTNTIIDGEWKYYCITRYACMCNDPALCGGVACTNITTCCFISEFYPGYCSSPTYTWMAQKYWLYTYKWVCP